jgi:hypothetical protein
LQQQFTAAVENQQGKRAVQDASTLVTLQLAQVTHVAVGFVH